MRASPGAELSISSDFMTSGGGAARTNEGDRWTFLNSTGVVRILGVENTQEKESPDVPLVDCERLNRTT